MGIPRENSSTKSPTFRACETHPDDLELLHEMTESWGLGDRFKPKIQFMLNKALHAKSASDRRLAARIT